VSRRVLIAGGREGRRRSLATSIDAVFDVDVVTAGGPFEAMRRLPNADFGLVLVLLPSEQGEAPGLDLVRFLSAHARHGKTPIALIGGSDDESQAGRALGAHLLSGDCGDDEIRSLVRDLLGLG
jgi:DNA-binding NarL/FixJ family response regulator